MYCVAADGQQDNCRYRSPPTVGVHCRTRLCVVTAAERANASGLPSGPRKMARVARVLIVAAINDAVSRCQPDRLAGTPRNTNRSGRGASLMARLVRPSTLSGVSPRKVTRRTILG